MNKEIIKSFDEKSDAELFDFFKHDGPLNFEKRIIAGCILKERRYNNQKLLKERALTVTAIKDNIKEHGMTEKIEARNRKKINLSTLWSFVQLVALSALSYYMYQNGTTNLWLLYVPVAVGLGSLAYNVLTSSGRLKKLMDFDKENVDLLKYRLQLIEREWQF